MAKSDSFSSIRLATLEGAGSFRTMLAPATKKQGVDLDVQVECSSFLLAARAVSQGGVAAVRPSIAAADLRSPAVIEIQLACLKTLDRQMCLASHPRLLRIRPILQRVTAVLADLCRF